MDAEEGLARNNENNDNLIISTGLDFGVPASEVNGNYVKTSVMLLRENTYSRGEVIGQKRGAYGNDVGRSNNKPIFDLRKHCVEFDDGEVRKLMANVIAKSMYSECNDSGNEYLMMDLIVDYHKLIQSCRVRSLVDGSHKC